MMCDEWGEFSNDDAREDELDVVQERPRIEAPVHGSGMLLVDFRILTFWSIRSVQEGKTPDSVPYSFQMTSRQTAWWQAAWCNEKQSVPQLHLSDVLMAVA